MSQHPADPAGPAPPDVPDRAAARATSLKIVSRTGLVLCGIGVAIVVAIVAMTQREMASEHPSSTAAIGYVFAAIFALPPLVCGAIILGGLRVRRSNPGAALSLAWVGTLGMAAVLVLVLLAFLP